MKDKLKDKKIDQTAIREMAKSSAKHLEMNMRV